MSRLVVFRVDASLSIGSGHLIRCRNLARILRERCIDSLFIYRPHSDSIASLLLGDEFPSYQLPPLSSPLTSSPCSSDFSYSDWLGCDESTDAKDFISLLASVNISTFDYIVVDHYAIGSVWETMVKSIFSSTSLIAIDDLANRDHQVSYLVDANRFIYTKNNVYSELVPDDCRLLIGPQYAFSTPDYGLLSSSIPFRRSLKRVLIFFGGVDIDDWCSSALQAINCDPLSYLEIDVVLGMASPYFEKVSQYVSCMPNATLHSSLPTLSGLISRADLALGAGGISSWERACLGLPSVVISVSSNQIQGASSLQTAGAVIHLGCPSPDLRVQTIRDAVISLHNNPSDLLKMSIASKQICDGNGLQRISTLLAGPLPPFSLCPATESVCRLYFVWANDPVVRAQSFTTDPISYSDHLRWYKNALISPDILLFILKDRCGLPLGQIRFSRACSKSSRVKISFSLDSFARGYRLSSILLKMGLDALMSSWEETSIIFAQVKSGNIASSKSFLSFGFSEVALKDPLMRQFEISSLNYSHEH